MSHEKYFDSFISPCCFRDTGYVYPDSVNRWFSEYLGEPVRLVRKSSTLQRGSRCRALTRDESSSASIALGAHISFSNESQFLVVTRASVNDVAARVQSEHTAAGAASSPAELSSPAPPPPPSPAPASLLVSHHQFRPNLVVAGVEQPAFVEDRWASMQIGERVHLLSGGPCARCQMVCVNQVDGSHSPEAFLRLAQYRRDSKGRILFGVHMSLRDDLLTTSQDLNQQPLILHVGDRVRVTGVSGESGEA